MSGIRLAFPNYGIFPFYYFLSIIYSLVCKSLFINKSNNISKLPLSFHINKETDELRMNTKLIY